MKYVEWQQSTSVESPVYLDANILVGTIVNNHPLYRSCVQLTGDILRNKNQIIISMMSIDETMWASAHLAYCKIFNLPTNGAWNKKIYTKWHEKIFGSYGSWISAAGDMLKDWKNAGVNISFVPNTDTEYEAIIDLAPQYMNKYELTPADAFHLAVAEKRAKTFITADSDFGTLRNNIPLGDLVIIHMPLPRP